MKWFEFDGYHINTDKVRSFYWKDRFLNIMFNDGCWLDFEDTDGSRYRKMCAFLGVIPTEVKENG